ncbi:hypothetical protein OY671_012895, partial [Metschnikowia pulcherrima]
RGRAAPHRRALRRGASGRPVHPPHQRGRRRGLQARRSARGRPSGGESARSGSPPARPLHRGHHGHRRALRPLGAGRCQQPHRRHRRRHRPGAHHRGGRSGLRAAPVRRPRVGHDDAALHLRVPHHPAPAVRLRHADPRPHAPQNP